MANKFKYNKLGSEANSIFKGNWAIDNTARNTGGGPSSATSFYHGANIPEGGYTVYSPNGVFVANNDTELVGKVNSLGADVTDISQALTWASGQSTHMVLNKQIDNIVTSGLVLNVDASHVSSFNDSKPTVNVLPSSNALLTSYHDHGGTHTTDSGFTLFGNASLRNTSNPAQYWNGVYLTGMSAILTPGVTYTYSFYIYFTTDQTTIIYFGYGAPGFTGVRGKWNRVSHTFVATSQDYFYVALQVSDNLPVSAFYLANLQIEAKSEATPFVNGARSQNTTWRDLSNSNNNGTLANGTSFNSKGSITFDGVDDEVNTSYTAQLNDFTTTVLFKDGGTAAWGRMVDKGYTDGFFISNHFATYGAGYVGCGIIEPSPPHGVALQYDTGRWHSFTSVRSGTNQTIYLDGVLNNATRSVSAATLNATTVSIGAWSGATDSQRFTGNISKVLMYNRALTTTEISQNYHGAPIVTNGLTFAVDAGNLVSYESGSTTTYSLTGSETGTLVNGVGYNTGNGGSWTFDGGDDYIQLNSSVIPAGNEISISFWNFGINAPSSSIIAASFNSSDQTLNIHLPWSNNGIYWDCGYPFNRIDKIATNAEYQGWHNWVFTKNATTGNMSIYLDGALWHSGSGLTSTIPTMTAARMGSYWNSQLYHSGRIAQCLIHNRALTADEVKQNFSAQRNRFGI
jgi:hypothetical protein